MAQAKLPDINASLVTHRGVMLSAYSKQDYAKVLIAFRSMIALMPDEYRLKINTQEYYDEIRAQTFITCSMCKKSEIPFSEITLYDKLNDYYEELTSGEKYSKNWICPHCKKSNNLMSSSTLLELPEDPIYFKMIPVPPVYENTFSRLRYSNVFDSWFTIALPELEHQIALFRTQYISEANRDEEDFETEDIGDYNDE